MVKNSTIEEKKSFIEKIKKFVEKDEYGFDNDIEKALYGMCKTKEDIELIKENYKIDREYFDNENFDDFYLELYEKIGAEKGFYIEYVDKLI